MIVCRRFWNRVLLATALHLLVGLAATAQTTTLSGRVVDATTGKVLPFVNVYLNGTTRGTLTNEQGRFDLPNVPLGTIELAASCVGYQSMRQTLRFDLAKPTALLIKLKPDDRALSSVTVRAKSKDRQWQRQFRQFRRQLLGEPFADKCLITNSFALSFTDEKGHLKATASEPLIIENQALGYRLRYDLYYFDGSLQRVYYSGTSQFEELPATDSQQAERYRRNRMRAYRGSLRHLMASLVRGTQEEEGFLVYFEDITRPLPLGGGATLVDAVQTYQRLIPVNTDSLIRPGKLAFERRLESPRPIIVFYTKASSRFSPYRDAPYAYSQLKLPLGWIQFTTEGWMTDHNGLELTGSLADEGLSTLLPADWTPTSGLRTRSGQTESADDSLATVPLVRQGKLVPPDARSGRIAKAFAEQFGNLAPTVFLHIDKPLYTTGDPLWVSAYLLDAATNRRLTGETAMQADLLTPAGRLVQHQWLHVVDGRASAMFRLSDSLASGVYRLRGYTDEDDGQRRPAFERPVWVYNGLEHGVPVSARIPARLALPDTVRARASSPAALSLTVDAVRDTTRLTIRIDGPSPARPDVARPDVARPDSAYLLVQQRGQIVDQRKVILDNGAAILSLPVITLPTGLVQLRLYDAAAQLQAERFVFLPERLPPVQVLITANKPVYQPRERVTLTINLSDDGRPIAGALSASVTDAQQVPDDTAVADVQTHLLLSGELGDWVDRPGAYLKNRRLTDPLLAGQRWRRLSGTSDANWLGGVSVMGQILDASNQPMPGAQIILASTKTGQSFVRSAGADDRGRFRLAGFAIADTLPVLVQLTDRQLKTLPLSKAHFVPERAGRGWPTAGADTLVNWAAVSAQLKAARLRQETQPDLYRDKSVKLLAAVTVRARRQDELDDVRRMSLHNGADATLVFDDDAPRFANLFEMIRGRLPGVTVGFRDGVYTVVIRGIGTITGSMQPLFLVDGITIRDPADLLAFNPIDIERVELLKNATTAGMYGVRGGNGVIAFYSKRFRPGKAGNPANATSQTLPLIGYPAVPPGFSVPLYDAGAPVAEQTPVDRRDVLYWKPGIQTDASGFAQLQFPLSDVVRTLRVTIQGIAVDGRPISAVRLIQVQ